MSTPSTARSSFRSYLTPLIEGRAPITATTSSAGDAGGTTLIASSLVEYYDDFGQNGYFNGWYVNYDTAGTAAERRIKEFVPETGTIQVYRAFAAQTATSKAIEIHPYPLTDFNAAINLSLKDVYSDGLYFNPKYDATLWGQNSYGTNDDFDKFTYAVPTAFQKFPTAIHLREAYIGEHDGGDGDAALSDSDRSWKTSELVGETVYNKTDGSSGTITANTSTTITATLAGGTDNDWDDDDEYIVAMPNRKPESFNDYKRTGLAQRGAFKFWADIPENYLIILEGEGPLTAYTTDAGTTELYEDDARIVAMQAAYRFCEMMAARYGGDREEWNQRAQEWWTKFHNQTHGGLEKPSKLRIDRAWL